jgi:membrane fusion protein, multidrug efflux system
MKRFYVLPVLGLILVVLILIKIVHQRGQKKSEMNKPVAQAVLAECTIARDTLVDFTYKAVGHTRANERVDLVAELPLRLLSIHFKEGAKVGKGNLLFQLDDSEIRANLKKVRAKLELAVETEKRNSSLLASGGTSQQVYDESVSNRKVLEAEEELLKVQLGKTQIRAPFAGVIGIRNVSPGAYLTPGMVLTTLEDLGRLKIELYVSESYAGLVQKGQKISFRMDGEPGVFEAEIDAVDPSVDHRNGNLRILALMDNSGFRLKAGVAVSIVLVSRSEVPSVYLPTQALIPTPGGYHVYTVGQGKAVFQPVSTGLRTESMVEIVKGVSAGDSVLVTGFMKVRPNAKVKIIKVW